MNWWTAAPTAGSFMWGLAILGRQLLLWWPGLDGKTGIKGNPLGAFLSFLPLLLSYCYGMLLILGVGGIVGWIADGVVWSVGWVGDTALVYGVGGSRQSLASGQVIALNNGGLMWVLCFAVWVFTLRKVCSRQTAETIGAGVLAGVLTGTVASVSAVFAVPLASAMNGLGDLMIGVWT